MKRSVVILVIKVIIERDDGLGDAAGHRTLLNRRRGGGCVHRRGGLSLARLFAKVGGRRRVRRGGVIHGLDFS